MVSVLASSAVDRGFKPRSDQTKDYNIGICFFCTKHAALRRFVWESVSCVRVGRHVYQQTVVSVI